VNIFEMNDIGYVTKVRIQVRQPKSRSKRIRRKFAKNENNWKWVDPSSPVARYWYATFTIRTYLICCSPRRGKGKEDE
jgi:hypothetical protein